MEKSEVLEIYRTDKYQYHCKLADGTEGFLRDAPRYIGVGDAVNYKVYEPNDIGETLNLFPLNAKKA